MSERQPSEDKLARESDVTVSTNVTLYAEYKGFFTHIISGITITFWIGWAILPETFLNKYLSIYYFPDRYWSLAIPMYFLVVMLSMYTFISIYNTEVLTLPLDDIRNFVDEHAVFVSTAVGAETHDEVMDCSIEYIHKAPSGVWDLPVTLANEVLYCDRGDLDVLG